MNICYDETFWEEYEILMYDKERMDNTSELVNKIITLMGINKESSLLDVCCGFGRFSQEFANKNIKTTGIDITKYYLDRAKNSRIKNDNPIYIEQDILKFNHENQYDFAINMFTSFGLLEYEDDEIIALENVYNSLKPGGKYLIDTQGKELVIRDYEKNVWFESGDTKAFYEYTLLNSFTILKSRWLYYKNNLMHERTFNTRIYTALELATMLSSVGFSSVEIYGDFLGNPYDYKAKRLIVIGIK